MQLWYNLLHVLNYYLNRNCLLRLETSIVSMSITSMFWNPSSALRKTVTDWSDLRLNLLNIHCTVISADFLVSRILFFEFIFFFIRNEWVFLKNPNIDMILWWTITYQILQQLTPQASRSDHQNLTCLLNKLQTLQNFPKNAILIKLRTLKL